MQWRLIPLEINSAALNMALDEACMHFLSKGDVFPTIRFYRWQPSAVSIGYFQNLDDEVDIKNCERNGIDVVRRITGGGAVFHGLEGEITYSIIAPEEFFDKSIKKSYKQICFMVVNALKLLGLDASFKEINDVMVGKRKISGSAQTRKDGILLQHGTVLYKADAAHFYKFLKVNNVKLDAKAIKSVNKLICAVSDLIDISLEDLYEVLLDSFVESKVWMESSWTEEEIELAKRISKEKYSCAKHLCLR